MRDDLATEYKDINAYKSVFAQLMLDARIEVTAAYALNYLELQVLKLTLVSTVLYNAIKEYYNDRTRKTIYFYSYTVENDYHDNDEETRVRLRKLSEKIHDILLREFRRANDFTESVTHNDDEQLEDCDALVERYKEEINCSNLYSTI
ncbi:hypothetical protein HBH51_187950 [Parastagonospora nodorum]|nr:hypothetical protein HBH51_187950 [Parastagonospora nodorum]